MDASRFVACLAGAVAFIAAPCAGDSFTVQTVAQETFDSLAPGDSIDGLRSVGVIWLTDHFIAAASPSICRADLNADNVVNSADLAELLARWNSPSVAADLNFSGRVDPPDLAELLAVWGDCAALPPTIAAQSEPGAQPTALALGASAITDDPLIPPPSGAIQIIFDIRPASVQPVISARIASLTEGFVTAGLDVFENNAVLSYGVGGFVTSKPILFDEWATVVIELSRPDEFGATFQRTLLRDAQTVALFGPEPVEIFPGGPFGPAINPTNGQQAPDPSPSPLAAWDQLSWLLSPEVADGSLTRFDNLRIRRIEPSTSD